MPRKLVLLLTVLLAHGFSTGAIASEVTTTAPMTGIVTAAKNFLATLDATQRARVVYDFQDDTQRKRWTNFPATSGNRRGGLRMGDLKSGQRQAVLALLAAALSPQGYQKVLQITEGDEVLRGPFGRSMFGRDEYYVSLLGQPSITEPWMLQFGGHHLGLNVTLVGERGTLAPTLTGAQPASFTLEGKLIRPLGREVDKAFALVSSLNAQQRDGVLIQPEGIKGSALTTQQREMLLDLASEWTGILNNAHARTKMDELRNNIAETWFAWSGPVERDRAAYFRIQGPTVHIEYAPQGRGGDHIHTIYRDPGNDYGAKWWSR
jgi:hypothetical protein